MGYQKVANNFALLSKICGVLLAPAIIFSTAATHVLFSLLLLFTCVAGRWRLKVQEIIYNPVALTFLLFYSLFLVGALYSSATTPEICLVLRKYSKFLLALWLFPLFQEERWRHYAIYAFIIGALILLGGSYLRSYGWLTYGIHNGTVEVFKSSIEFNLIMAFAAYLVLVKAVYASKYRWVWLAVLGLFSYTILFRSMGRSGYFVFAALLVLFFGQQLKWRGVVGALVGVAILFSLTFVSSPIFKERIDAIFHDLKIYQHNQLTSVGERLTFVKNGTKLILAHPLIGSGTGSFAREYARLQPAPVATTNPHNEYIYITVQFGVLGLAILLLLFGVPLWYSTLLTTQSQYIARGIIVGIMVGSLANSWLLDSTPGHLYLYFIALAFAGAKFWERKLP